MVMLMVLITLPSGPIEANQQPIFVKITNAVTNPAQSTPAPPYQQNFPVVFKGPAPTCHFGIAVVNSVNDYDLSTLGVGSYLDWSRLRNSSVPANIDYYNVLNVGDINYAAIKAQLPGLLMSNPGATWLIGNEPDAEVTYQDHVSAETYGERFFELATIIRQNDPKAKIGFGTVIQLTPIRIFYLTKALNRLVQLAGSAVQAHALIDVYAVHGFNLNEQPLYDANGKNISWGAGVPIGYDPATWPAPEVIRIDLGETYKTYDINIFKSRVINFRQWMKDEGEQNKPLWITEFGSLFPSIGNIYLQVSDLQTANFMDQTYDFMLGEKDPQLGFNDDDNRLVQKWTWYSLDQYRNVFGGSLFDPLTHQLTPVGERFMQYEPSLAAVPVTNPDVYMMTDGLRVTPVIKSSQPGRVNYKITVKVSNNLSSDRHTGVQIDLFDAGTLIGSIQTELPRCGGTALASFLMNGLLPGSMHTFTARVTLLAGNGIDTNPANNQVAFAPISLTPLLVYYLPAVYR